MRFRAVIGLQRRVIELLADCDGPVLRSLKIMDPALLPLLETIAAETHRSTRETHRALIRRLRRKGCVCPVVYGISRGIATAVGAAIHNVVSNWIGGVEADMS